MYDATEEFDFSPDPSRSGAMPPPFHKSQQPSDLRPSSSMSYATEEPVYWGVPSLSSGFSASQDYSAAPEPVNPPEINVPQGSIHSHLELPLSQNARSTQDTDSTHEFAYNAKSDSQRLRERAMLIAFEVYTEHVRALYALTDTSLASGHAERWVVWNGMNAEERETWYQLAENEVQKKENQKMGSEVEVGVGVEVEKAGREKSDVTNGTTADLHASFEDYMRMSVKGKEKANIMDDHMGVNDQIEEIQEPSDANVVEKALIEETQKAEDKKKAEEAAQIEAENRDMEELFDFKAYYGE